MKKGFVCVLAALMLLALAACDLPEKSYTVGVCQYDSYPALDDTVKGFQDALTEKLGERATVQVETASGSSANCGSILDGFVSGKADLILACGAPALQAAVPYLEAVSVLGAAVADYPSALGFSGANITGASDLVSPDEQAAMIPEMFPHAQNVGILYSSQEPDSQYQADRFAESLENMGLSSTSFPFTDSSDLPAAVQNACQESDVIFVPTGACVSVNTGIIRDITVSAGVPVVAGNADICEGCGTVTLAVSYYDLGYQAGEMAAQILIGEADIFSLPVIYATETTKLFNAENCAALGVTIPEGYAPLG